MTDAEQILAFFRREFPKFLGDARNTEERHHYYYYGDIYLANYLGGGRWAISVSQRGTTRDNLESDLTTEINRNGNVRESRDL